MSGFVFIFPYDSRVVWSEIPFPGSVFSRISNHLCCAMRRIDESNKFANAFYIVPVAFLVSSCCPRLIYSHIVRLTYSKCNIAHDTRRFCAAISTSCTDHISRHRYYHHKVQLHRLWVGLCFTCRTPSIPYVCVCFVVSCLVCDRHHRVDMWLTSSGYTSHQVLYLLWSIHSEAIVFSAICVQIYCNLRLLYDVVLI